MIWWEKVKALEPADLPAEFQRMAARRLCYGCEEHIEGKVLVVAVRPWRSPGRGFTPLWFPWLGPVLWVTMGDCCVERYALATRMI